jgi:hypothetical protein
MSSTWINEHMDTSVLGLSQPVKRPGAFAKVWQKKKYVGKLVKLELNTPVYVQCFKESRDLLIQMNTVLSRTSS